MRAASTAPHTCADWDEQGDRISPNTYQDGMGYQTPYWDRMRSHPYSPDRYVSDVPLSGMRWNVVGSLPALPTCATERVAVAKRIPLLWLPLHHMYI